MSKRPVTSADDTRRQKLLDAAVGVFLRYGFRKTSMDEVARAAGVSRQGLYLHFPTKEDLFRAGVRSVLERSTEQVKAALATEGTSTHWRLVNAVDAWMGQFVGPWSTAAADLGEFSNALVADDVAAHENNFAELVTDAFKEAARRRIYKEAGVSARHLSETLIAAGRGLKYQAGSRERFVDAISRVVQVLCAPLEEDL